MYQSPSFFLRKSLLPSRPMHLMQLTLYFPSSSSGMDFVRGRSLHIRAGHSAVQGKPLVRVTTATEAQRETPPTVRQYDAKRRPECRCRSLAGWGGNGRWLLFILFVRVAFQLIFLLDGPPIGGHKGFTWLR